jgi:beta-1,4-mannosyltransferase
MAREKVAVLVFGDVGRSPRMQNHALLLADYYDVNLVGDNESKVYPEIQENKNISMVDLSSKTISLAKKTNIFVFYLLVRIIVQTFSLLWTFLVKLRGLKFVVVQNPPSIPVLAVLWFASLLKGFEVVVDFHNYGHTILALKVRSTPVLKIA